MRGDYIIDKTPILKKIKKSFEKVLTTSKKRDNIYLADAEKSQ